MKTAQRKGMEDVQEEVWHVCNLLHHIDKAVSPSYLIRLLKGLVQYGLHHPSHIHLESLGSLSDSDSDRLRCLFRYMIDQVYLERVSIKTGSMKLAEKGLEFYQSPFPIILYPRQLNHNRYEKEIFVRLKQLRKNLAKEEGFSPYIIFSDFTLEELAFHQPDSLETLREIPGMGDKRINRYGSKLLSILQDIRLKKISERKLYLANLVQRPSFKEVKALFESGMDLRDMAQKRKVKESTVRRMLMDLHEAGELDITHWIEQEVPSETLSKGSAYFKSREHVRLSIAFKDLGLAYDTLKMCRLYVSRFSQCEEVWDFGYSTGVEPLI